MTQTDMTVLEELQSFYSDYHKEVHGFRPRFMTTEEWNSESWLEDAIERLRPIAAEVFAREAQEERERIASFEVKVDGLLACGAEDRKAAIRWMMDACQDPYMDEEYFCYLNGLPYGYFKGVK